MTSLQFRQGAAAGTRVIELTRQPAPDSRSGSPRNETTRLSLDEEAQINQEGLAERVDVESIRLDTADRVGTDLTHRPATSRTGEGNFSFLVNLSPLAT